MATETKEESKASDKKTQDDILALARERFKLAEDAEVEIRRLALEDIRFSIGEQWPERMRRERELEARPCLTINRLPQTIHQITNDQRQNRPAIKVSPVDDRADIETAKIYQGLIRHIEYSSDADTAYDVAFDSAVRGGFGFFRIVTEYCDPYSFDQEIRIKEVRNRFSAYLDPNYQKIDGSDASWGTVFTTFTDDEFKSQWPDAELSKMTDWGSIGDVYASSNWVQKNQCRVAEYFTKTFKKIKLYQLDNGQVLKKEDYEKILKESPQLLEGVEISNERDSVEPAIKWYKHNGLEILEETDWPGQWIPIIPVHGDMIDVEGERVLEGVVRHAKDPQRMYNFWASAETETIALAPKAPWIGAEGQFEGHKAKWNSANVRNHPFLEYKPISLNGQLMPPPQRLAFEPATQAISQARMLASEDLKATTGIYDAALGNRSNENSGIAIQRRNIQAQTSNFHFIDNLSKSIRHAGRIIVDIIPKFYDAPRTIRILGEDGKEEILRVNEQFQKKNGEVVNYNLNAGKYDVTVSTGPSYQTKRQEAAAAMLELSTKVPQLMNVAPDLVIKSLDIPDSEILAERLKKTLPPGLADDDENKKPIPPQVQAQMQQMNQMLEALTQQLNEANEKIQNKTLELESRERIEFAKMDVDMKKELAKLDADASKVLFMQEIGQINRRLDMLKINEPIEEENQMEFGAPGAATPNEMNPEQQPTGGISPGQPMGV